MSNINCQKRNNDKWHYYYLPYKIGQANLGVLVPLFILDLGGSANEIGIITMLFSLFTLISTVIWGRLSDETGKRKQYILIGFIGLSICFMLLAFSFNVMYVAIIYSVMAVLISAELPITPVYILKNLGDKSWDDTFGRFNSICSWGLTLGLVIGALALAVFDIYQTSLIIFILSSASIFLVLFLMKDTSYKFKRGSTGLFPTHIIERKRFIPNFVLHLPHFSRTKNSKTMYFFLSIVFLFIGSNFVFIPIIPFLRQMGVGDSMIFVTNIMNFVASSLIYSRISKDVKKNGCLKVLRKGLVLRMAIVGSMMAGLFYMENYSFFVVLLCYTLIGASWPHIYTSAITFVSQSSESKGSGSIMGKYNAFYTLGLMIGSLASGYLFDISSILYCLLLSIVFYALAYLIVYRYVGTHD